MNDPWDLDKFKPEKGLIYKLMAKVMGEIGPVAKGQRNKQQGYDYRGIDDIYNALNGIMAKYGIFTTSDILERWREERTSKGGSALIYTTLRMRYTFWAPDGSCVTSIVDGEGMDSGDKSSNKAMAVAHKYLILQAFCIPTKEIKDPDAESHEVAPKADAKILREAVKQIRDLLADGDDLGIAEITRELDAHEKAALWSYFSSQERASIKTIMESNKSL